jgi:hypothetical protein
MSDMHRHGSPYDRGRADAYYGRLFCPHYFKGATYQSEYVTIADMTIDEIEQYEQGFNECTERKDWGSDEPSAVEDYPDPLDAIQEPVFSHVLAKMKG